MGKLLLGLPLWSIFLATVALLLLSAGAGFWLGRCQGQRTEETKKILLTEVFGPMFGLLAFMLAFTFSLAASRFDAKKALVVNEANAIGTTYMRAGLLPEPYRAETRKLLHEYVEVRLSAVQSGQIAAGIARSEELQGKLWAVAEAASRRNSDGIFEGFFISSLNEMIDLHNKRVALGLRNHIPKSIWSTLCFLAACAIGMLGYTAGLAGARKVFAIIPLVLMFSVVLMLIADLDRPQEGSFKVNQKPLVDLLKILNGRSPGPGIPQTN